MSEHTPQELAIKLGVINADQLKEIKELTEKIATLQNKINNAEPFLQQLYNHIRRSCHSERLAYQALWALGLTPKKNE